MKLKRLLCGILLTILLVMLTACSSQHSPNTKPYEGRPLRIGIIGTIPEVHEDKVKFNRIEFSDLVQDAFESDYDAVFITKENLSQAAEADYASVYEKSRIPFFFIQNKKGYIPFVMKDLSYQGAPSMAGNYYATGILCSGDKYLVWEYGLYNDVENEANIKDVYARIFETISHQYVSKVRSNHNNADLTKETVISFVEEAKVQDYEELSALEYDKAYELGKLFLKDYYMHKSGKKKMDFSKYITNKNLLKYSNKRMEVEKHTLNIVGVSIGLGKAELRHKHNCFYFNFATATKNSFGGGSGESVELLVSKTNGRLVVSDWYIPWGPGSSSFDERNRPFAKIESPKVWDDMAFVSKIFHKAGIK